MSVSKLSTNTNMSNGTTAFRAYNVANTPVSITTATNGATYAYETFSTSGADITSAINTSGYGGCVWDSFTTTSGRVYRVKFNLTLVSGTLPNVRIVTSNSGQGTVVAGCVYAQAKNGANEIIFCPTATGTAYLEVSVASAVTTSFSITGMSVDEQVWTVVSNTVAYDYFSNSAVVGDAIVFSGWYGSLPPHALWFQVGTALAAAGITVKWEYSQTDPDKMYQENAAYNSPTWATLTVTDGTNTFQTTGQNTVSWIPPTDMGLAYISAASGYQSWFIRCEITSVTSITEGGANATNASKVVHDSIEIVGGYTSGTITSTTETSGRTYAITDTSKTWTPRELEGRHIWFATGNGAPKCWMVRTNTASTIYIGLPPSIVIPQGSNLPMTTNPAAGDSYVVGHTMEDVRLADVAGSWGLVTASDWVNQWKKYRNYYLRASVYIRPTSATNYSLFGEWGTNISFNLMYSFSWAGTYWAAGRFAFGLRDLNGYDSSGTYSLNNEVSYLGCHISVNNYSYANPGMYINGFVNGTLFTNTTKYSFTQYIYAHGEWFNNILSCTQLNNYAADLTGKTLIHFAAEPNRNPLAGVFELTDYRCSGGAAAYLTAAGNYFLDSPYSSTYYAFQSYNPWVSGYYGDVIDKHPQTFFGFNIALAGGTTSGMWRFYYRLNLKVVDRFGNAISGAAIKVQNAAGTVEFTDTTASTGLATANSEPGTYPPGNKVLYGYKQTATAGYSTGLTGTYGPFTITVTKSGYEPHVEILNITKREDLTIKLKEQLTTRRVSPALIDV